VKQTRWRNAQKFCSENGLKLATVNIQEEMNKLSDAAAPFKGNNWRPINSNRLYSKFSSACYFCIFLTWSKHLFIFSVKGEHWLDASDIGQQPGHFLWADGTKVDRALWGSGEPDHFSAGKEACVELNANTRRLYDVPCSIDFYSFICEVAEKDLPCFS